MSGNLSEPQKYYQDVGKKDQHERVMTRFDALVRESGVDLEANRQTIEQWAAEKTELENRKTELMCWYFLAVFLAFVVLLGFMKGENAPLLSVCLVLAGGGLLVFVLRSVRLGHTEKAERKQNVELLQEEARSQVAPLAEAIGSMNGMELVELPQVSLQRCTNEHLAKLMGYGFREEPRRDRTALRVQAGELNGQPFQLVLWREFYMVPKAYECTPVIVEWTEPVTENGEKKKVARSQELKTDPIIRDVPEYRLGATLWFGHSAVPELSFSRKPGNAHKLSDKGVEKRIRSGKNRLRKLAARKTDFEPMINDAFEVLFNASDRSDEVQFRELFTPLAQVNMTELLRDGSLCGDRFCMNKEGRITTIEMAEESAPGNFTVNKEACSAEDIRREFVQFHDDRFRAFFSYLAPILAIPAYHEPSAPPDPVPVPEGRCPLVQYEALANALDAPAKTPEKCQTKLIIHAKRISSMPTEDIVQIRSSGFMGVPRIHRERKKAGDDNWYTVKTEYVEYLPVEKTFQLSVAEADPKKKIEGPGIVTSSGFTAIAIEGGNRK